VRFNSLSPSNGERAQVRGNSAHPTPPREASRSAPVLWRSSLIIHRMLHFLQYVGCCQDAPSAHPSARKLQKKATTQSAFSPRPPRLCGNKSEKSFRAEPQSTQRKQRKKRRLLALHVSERRPLPSRLPHVGPSVVSSTYTMNPVGRSGGGQSHPAPSRSSRAIQLPSPRQPGRGTG
jgi:hypothetical protein